MLSLPPTCRRTEEQSTDSNSARDQRAKTKVAGQNFLWFVFHASQLPVAIDF